MADSRALAKAPQAFSEMQELDDRGMAAIAASIVTTGDLSALSDLQRAQYYIYRCKSLGIDPASKPFDLIYLNGKLVMYPKKECADQLARNRNLSREIIDGPRVVEIDKAKLVYAVCRVSTPDGRSETDVSTTELKDLANCFMKAVTKAKRRATLSFCGVGGPDESELETIPAHLKREAEMVDLSLVDPAIESVQNDLASYDHSTTIEAAATIYVDRLPEMKSPEVTAAAFKHCHHACPEKTPSIALQIAIAKEKRKRGLPLLPKERAELEKADAKEPKLAPANAPVDPSVNRSIDPQPEVEPSSGISLMEYLSHARQAPNTSVLEQIVRSAEDQFGNDSAETERVREACRNRWREISPRPPRGGQPKPAENDTGTHAEGEPTEVLTRQGIAVAQWIEALPAHTAPDHVANSLAAHESEFGKGAAWHRAQHAYNAHMLGLGLSSDEAFARLRTARVKHAQALKVGTKRSRKPVGREIPRTITFAKVGS